MSPQPLYSQPSKFPTPQITHQPWQVGTGTKRRGAAGSAFRSFVAGSIWIQPRRRLQVGSTEHLNASWTTKRALEFTLEKQLRTDLLVPSMPSPASLGDSHLLTNRKQFAVRTTPREYMEEGSCCLRFRWPCFTVSPGWHAVECNKSQFVYILCLYLHFGDYIWIHARSFFFFKNSSIIFSLILSCLSVINRPLYNVFCCKTPPGMTNSDN